MSALVGRRANTESRIVARNSDIACGKEWTEFDSYNLRGSLVNSNGISKFLFYRCSTKRSSIVKKDMLREREFDIFEVAIEGGYGDSIALPGFGSESDEITY